jgi:hypothetical protein
MVGPSRTAFPSSGTLEATGAVAQIRRHCSIKGPLSIQKVGLLLDGLWPLPGAPLQEEGVVKRCWLGDAFKHYRL